MRGRRPTHEKLERGAKTWIRGNLQGYTSSVMYVPSLPVDSVPHPDCEVRGLVGVQRRSAATCNDAYSDNASGFYPQIVAWRCLGRGVLWARGYLRIKYAQLAGPHLRLAQSIQRYRQAVMLAGAGMRVPLCARGLRGTRDLGTWFPSAIPAHAGKDGSYAGMPSATWSSTSTYMHLSAAAWQHGYHPSGKERMGSNGHAC